MDRPDATEFAEYYNNYVSRIEGNGVIPILEAQSAELRSALSDLPEGKGTHSYGDGKWTIKEVLSHIIDAERIFAYRILRISRGDETPIEGFEQDGYIETSNANNRPFAELLEEFELQRKSNLLLLKNIDAAGSQRMGTASGFPVSVRALAYISAGHVRHHLGILNERYLNA